MNRFTKAMAIALAATVLLSFIVSCTPSQTQGDVSQNASSDTEKDTVGYPSYTTDNSTFWTPIYLTTSAMKKESYFGASANNAKSDIVVLGKAPDTVFVSTTDAGVLKSLDAATLWQNSSIGINSLGIDALAADPNNPDIITGACTSSTKANGIYISENGGQTWSFINSSPELVINSKVELLFDRSSYNSQTDSSSVIYLRMSQPSADGESLLMRSDDSGMNFKVIRTIDEDAKIAIHPTKSYVYLADKTGFYYSINRGFSFEPVMEGSFTDVLVSPAEPDTVMLVTADGKLITSRDSRSGFEEGSKTLPSGITGICVSPLDINFMLAYTVNKNKTVTVVYTSNGGANWHESTFFENAHTMSEKNGDVQFAWSLTDASVVYAIVNNSIYKSLDYGALFTWSGNGDDSFDMNGKASQNIHSPSYLAFAVNQNTIALTTDGGSVWSINTYPDFSSRLSIKSIYPITRSVLIAIVENTQSGVYSLRISTNGGEYFNPTGVECAENAYFYSDPSDKNIIFASNLRSTDGGQNWKEMSGCDYVLTHNPVSPNELFGVKGTSVVVSYDKGNKWQRLVNAGAPILDLSYDYLQSAVYAAVGDGLVKYYIKENRLESCISSAFSNVFGDNIISLVETDPLYPNVVYAGGKSEDYANDCSILISENSGKNWYVASSTKSNQTLASACQGGIQPVDMVLTENRELVVFSAKFGIHKFSAYKPER